MLTISPLSLREAQAYIDANHRHHKRPQGHKFTLALKGPEGVHGVCVVGRPVSRHHDDGLTVEVTRLCTDGTPNACSMLYGQAARAAKALGYKRILTYILASEAGTSLKASGWVLTAETRGGSWSVPSRPREDKHPTCPKTRWERQL